MNKPTYTSLCGVVFSVCLLAAPVAAQPETTRRTATTTIAASVFASANESEAPLRLAKEGSVMLLLDTAGDWSHIEFDDPEFGRRAGYVLTKYVRIERDSNSIQPSVAPARSNVAPSQVVDARRDAFVGQRPESEVRAKSASSKMFLGIDYEGAGIAATSGSASSVESGAGGGLIVGYGFTPRWALYANLSGANISSVTGDSGLGHFDVGTRVHFRTGPHVVVPFLQFGLSGRALVENFSTRTGQHTSSAAGAGVAFGGGLNAHFTPAFAFSGGVTWSVGNFTQYKLDSIAVAGSSSESYTSARVHVGLIWFPQMRGAKL